MPEFFKITATSSQAFFDGSPHPLMLLFDISSTFSLHSDAERARAIRSMPLPSNLLLPMLISAKFLFAKSVVRHALQTSSQTTHDFVDRMVQISVTVEISVNSVGLTEPLSSN